MNKNLYNHVKNVKWEENDFSIEKAYVCSEISKLVYNYKRKCPKDRVDFYDLTQTDTLIDEDMKLFQDLINQYEIKILFVLETPYGVTIGLTINNVIFVASRGTSYWQDWFINLNILKAKTDFGKVKFHKGFNNIADISVYKIWHKLQGRNEPIYFTGHSLGAAVSAILFLKFKYYRSRLIYNQRIKSVYTFGMPRFFNLGLFPIEDIHHFYNDLDIVPKIPFKIAGFQNLPCEYTFENKKLIMTMKRKSFQFYKSLKLLLKKQLIAQHNIDSYIKLIKEQIH